MLTLEENITGQVLDRCWADFTKRMETESVDISSLRREHETYIRTVASRCMVDPTAPEVRHPRPWPNEGPS